MPKEVNGAESTTQWYETEFKHPLLMNLLMFSGEAMLLILLNLQLAKDP
jgi:hypothetical protein